MITVAIMVGKVKILVEWQYVGRTESHEQQFFVK